MSNNLFINMEDLFSPILKENRINKKNSSTFLSKILKELYTKYFWYEGYFKQFKSKFKQSILKNCMKNNSKIDCFDNNINTLTIKNFLDFKNSNTFFLTRLCKIIYFHTSREILSLKDIFVIYLFLSDPMIMKEKKQSLIKYLIRIINKTYTKYLINDWILIYDFINAWWGTIIGKNKKIVKTNKLIVKRADTKKEWYVKVSGMITSKIETYYKVNPYNKFILIVDVFNNANLFDCDELKIYKCKKYHKIYHNI